MPAATSKPNKPRTDFPLFAHSNGQWAKKINGRLYYFGPWSSPDSAEERYDNEKRAIRQGMPRPARIAPTATPPKRWKVADGINAFLLFKSNQRDVGEISQGTLNDYRLTCELIAKSIDPAGWLDELRPYHFTKFKSKLSSSMNVVSVGDFVQRTRTVFNWLYEHGHLDRPARFGPTFKRPSKARLRRHKQEMPEKFLEASVIQHCISLAPNHFKALIFLGLNCGWGNTDLALVPRSAFDLTRGVVDFPRPKTSIERRATLWPETIEAIRLAWEHQPEPKEPAWADLAFLTREGNTWVDVASDPHQPKTRKRRRIKKKQKSKYTTSYWRRDSIGLAFGRLLRRVGAKQPRVNFYALRHVLETVGGEVLDQPAVNRIMGHEDGSMASVYRVWRKDAKEDERLRRVTDHVRMWFYRGLWH